ncbi:MAG: Ig-like domain-containing protein [Chloroflexota bacterium]
MMRRKQDSIRGQSLTEFAIVALFILLPLMFVLVESGRIFWGWTTVQSAAREGARYAITGQKMPGDECPVADLPKFSTREQNNACVDVPDFRPASVIRVAHDALAGMPLDENSLTDADDFFYNIEVNGRDKNGVSKGSTFEPYVPFAGDPNQPVTVRVTYRVPVITPFLKEFFHSVPVVGVVTLNNEPFGQLGNVSQGLGVPPPPPPLAPLQPPTAVNDTFVAQFGDPTIIPATGVLVNDTLRGGIIFEPPTTTDRGGTLDWEIVAGEPTGGFTYTPPAGEEDEDTFAYQLRNGSGLSGIAVVTMLIDPPPPVLANKTYELFANEVLNVPDDGNLPVIRDGSEDQLYGAVIDLASSDTETAREVFLDLDAAGGFQYVPPIKDNVENYTDTFNFTVVQSITNETATAAVTIIVKPPPPDPDADSYTTFVNQQLTIPADRGVLVGDRFIAGTAIVDIGTRTTSQNGTVVLNPDGSFIYTPAPGYISLNRIADTFTYTLREPEPLAREATATVSITVLPLDPVARNDGDRGQYRTPMNESLFVPATLGVLRNDDTNGSDITGYTATTANGGSVILNSDGSFDYTPASDYFSPPADTFTYTLSNPDIPELMPSTATVSIIVEPPFPELVDDFYSTPVNTALFRDADEGLMNNDNVKGGVVTDYDTTSGEGGVVEVAQDGSFRYTPPADYASGPNDTFDYIVTNENGSATATVEVFVGVVDPENNVSGIARVSLPVPTEQEGVQVNLYDAENRLMRQTLTDVYGFYQFSEVPVGGYTLTACYRVGAIEYNAILTTTSPNVFADLFLMPGPCTNP